MKSSIRKLGVGHSTDKQSELIRCLNVSPVNVSLIGSPQSVLQFNGVSSYTEMARELDLDLSVHTKIGFGKASYDIDSSIHYTNYVKETDYTKSFIFNINAQLPSATLLISSYGVDTLTQDAANLYKYDPKKFRDTCGDQFILQENLGASLYISAKLDFATKTEKNTFSIDNSFVLSGVMGFFKLTNGAALNLVLHEMRMSLSIAVLQRGGNTTALNKYIPLHNGMGTLDCVKNSVGNITKCKEKMDDLLSYANNDFITDVDKNNFELSQTLSYYREYYKTIGIDPSTSAITPEIERIRKHLKTLYSDLTSTQEFLGKLLQKMPKGKSYMTIDNVQVGWNSTDINHEILADLHSANNTMTKAINEIETLDSTCYDEPSSCRDFTDFIDTSAIQVFNQSYTVTSSCNDVIYGPRYMLAIDRNLYKEDSILKTPQGNLNQTLIALYNVTQEPTGDKINIKINNNPNCAQTITKNTGYNLIDAYKTVFYGDCATMLCPTNLTGLVNSTTTEFILTETPI